jgi:hypothetical protein
LSHVTIDSGEVAGVAVPWRPACGACRVAIPRAEVDSMVLFNHEVGWVVAGAAGLLAVWMLNHCYPSVRCFD